MFNEFTPHPSLFTAIPVIGTLMILSINHKDLLFPVKFLINRKIIFVGMISYSLYLWHYPAIVFSRIFSINELDNLEKIIWLSLYPFFNFIYSRRLVSEVFIYPFFLLKQEFVWTNNFFKIIVYSNSVPSLVIKKIC